MKMNGEQKSTTGICASLTPGLQRKDGEQLFHLSCVNAVDAGRGCNTNNVAGTSTITWFCAGYEGNVVF